MKSQILEKFDVVRESFVINNSQKESIKFLVDFGDDVKIHFQAMPISTSLVKLLLLKDRIKECKILVECKQFVDKKTKKNVKYLDYKLFNNKDISIQLHFSQNDKDLYKFFVKEYIKNFEV